MQLFIDKTNGLLKIEFCKRLHSVFALLSLNVHNDFDSIDISLGNPSIPFGLNRGVLTLIMNILIKLHSVHDY